MKTDKYLDRQARIREFKGKHPNPSEIRQIVVIPARGENEHLPSCLLSLAANPRQQCENTWCLIVINNPPSGHQGAEYRNDNQLTMAWLRQAIPSFSLPVSYIDMASPGQEISPEYGVGMARKIGSDTAIEYLLRTYHANSSPENNREIRKRLIFHLDADTLVAPDYLAGSRCALRDNQADSGVIHFEHQAAAGEPLQQAINQYELYMRCYVQGLRWAGSPYAFHTVGSTMVSTVQAYITAGGVPAKRRAGEDFYFLQQLAKTGRLINIGETTVYPSPRPSTRVPFGTGPRMTEALTENQPDGGKIFDPATSFIILRQLLNTIDRNLAAEPEKILRILQINSPVAHIFLQQRNFHQVWNRFLQRCGDHQTAVSRAFHQWFDALATRQLIHTASKCRMTFNQVWPQWARIAGMPASQSMEEALSWLRKIQKKQFLLGKNNP